MDDDAVHGVSFRLSGDLRNSTQVQARPGQLNTIDIMYMQRYAKTRSHNSLVKLPQTLCICCTRGVKCLQP